jgi:hypothetical protein
MSYPSDHQRGIAHVGLIILVIAVLAAVGGIGYFVMNKNKAGSAADSAASSVTEKAIEAAAKAECAKNNDKDLCKFMTSWKASKQYRIVSTDSTGAKSTIEIDGDKSHMVMTGEMAYESIVIDKTIYTKSGNTWYKQTIKDPAQNLSESIKPEFEDTEDDTTAPTEDKSVYRKIGKEDCGKLTCFKYEVIDKDNADEKQLIWFDDKDYQLRKSRSESKDGTSSEQTYEYTGVKISAPSPVKELGPNQYIMPGSSEPVTMPNAEELMQQYHQQAH